jgi:hypothetical protein
MLEAVVVRPARRDVRRRRSVKSFAAGCALVAASLFGFAPAAAASHSVLPCWKVLINDWYDGRIDGTYPLVCYEAALRNAPEDVTAYSSLTSELHRAAEAAVAGKRAAVVPAGQAGRSGGDRRADPPPAGGSGGSGGGNSDASATSGGGGTGGSGGSTSAGGAQQASSSAPSPHGPGGSAPKASPTKATAAPSSSPSGASAPLTFKAAFAAGAPKSPTTVPIPLIVLAVVALLLLAAGSASFAVRRLRGGTATSRRALSSGNAELLPGPPPSDDGPTAPR